MTFRDTLPTGLNYVAGSTTWNNASQKNVKAGDTLTTSGVNVGSYATKANAWVIFSAKVAPVEQLACGTNTLTNKGNTGGYAVEDTATVTVDKECKPVVKYTCDALSVNTIDRTNFKFTTNYTVQNATFNSVTYVIKDATGKVVDTKTSNTNTLTYTQATAGKYTVQATVTVTVDGQTKTVTSDNCKAAFEVPSTPGNITVCELSTKNIITIKESDFDANKYSKNLADCKQTPVTPPELPHTGAGENIVALVGLGALIASIGYYIASRRALS